MQNKNLFSRSIKHIFGFILKDFGLLFDRFGAKLHKDLSIYLPLSRHRHIFPVNGKYPNISKQTYLCPSSTIIGGVEIDEGTIVMSNSTLKADVNNIRIGKNCYIGDKTLLRTKNLIGEGIPGSVNIANNVTIGNNCIIYASTIDENVVIEDNCIILEGTLIEKNTIIKKNTLLESTSYIKGDSVVEGKIGTYKSESKLEDIEKLHNKYRSLVTHFDKSEAFYNN